MEGFSRHSGTLAVLDASDIDTDRIIPARYLTKITRQGYGELLFKDVRGDGFALDQPEAQGASILVVGTNFGCGSSREHAVWAIQQAGYRAVIARRTPESAGFSDIFRQNAANCGLLLIELDAQDHALLTQAGSGAQATIDLVGQKVEVGPESLSFEIPAATKEQVLKGLDLVGTTLEFSRAIEDFESRSESFVPPAEGERPISRG